MSMSPETKQELILASFRAEVSIADLCRRAQVPESTFRDWRDRFIAAGTAALQFNKSSASKGDPEKTALIHENARLKTVVADLSVENLVLKKGRNGVLSRVTM
jgi:transposase